MPLQVMQVWQQAVSYSTLFPAFRKNQVRSDINPISEHYPPPPPPPLFYKDCYK